MGTEEMTLSLLSKRRFRTRLKGGMAMWIYRPSLMNVYGMLLVIIATAGLAAAEEKYGYIDTTGQLTIPPQFRSAQSFSDGLAAVQTETDGNWGYIDKTGKVVIPPGFVTAEYFSEGLARVQTHEGKNVYVDKTGKVTTPPWNQTMPNMTIGRFKDGLARIRVGGKVGFIDSTGKVVIEPLFDHASQFSEGLAPVKISKKWGFIDRSGEIVIPPQFACPVYFSEGLVES